MALVPGVRVVIGMDLHMQAIDWLDDHLEGRIFQFDIDDIHAMEEQVAMCEL